MECSGGKSYLHAKNIHTAAHIIGRLGFAWPPSRVAGGCEQASLQAARVISEAFLPFSRSQSLRSPSASAYSVASFARYTRNMTSL